MAQCRAEIVSIAQRPFTGRGCHRVDVGFESFDPKEISAWAVILYVFLTNYETNT